MAEISKITIPNPRAGESGQPASLTYDIKDATARTLIAQGIAFHFAQDANTTPFGVTWDDNGTLITGRLVASADTKGFYFVPAVSTSGKDIYAEYVATNNGGWEWEKLGDTEISISVSLVKSTDNVLGENTTFTASPSAVTFNSDGSSDTFVKSYPGSTSKLETTTIRGVGDNVTFNAVASNSDYTATNTVFGTNTTASKVITESKTATNTVFGTNTTASKIVTETKTASNTVFGTSTTASKATAGTAISLAKPASSATDVSRITLSSGNTASKILETATVAEGTEILVIGAVAVTQTSVTGINGSQSITPYTFADVTVPVVTSNDSVAVASVKTNTDVTVPVVTSNSSVSVNSVKTNTDVTVPVVTSNDSVTATKITVASKTAATSASSTTTVATGSLKSNDTNGATIMTGLGTAQTGTAITGLPSASAAGQTITVGSNDIVTVLDDDTDVVVD